MTHTQIDREIGPMAAGQALANGFIVWSYGTGIPGIRDGELFGPHTAEENPFNPDEIVVAEQYGRDVLMISRSTGRLRVVYGQRGVEGTGALLGQTHSAHFMPSGPYEGSLLVTEWGEHRILIIDPETGAVRWQCTGLDNPLEAIYWDDDHVMASDMEQGVFRIRMSDGAKVWRHDPAPRGNPFYLQKLPQELSHYSYGGDLLISYFGDNRIVREVRTSDDSIVWEYGPDGTRSKHDAALNINRMVEQGPGAGDLYNRLSCPVCALRYGMNEAGSGLTIICDERSRIFCVNIRKELIWDLGGSGATDRCTATPHLVLPTYVSPCRRGTLLITDWGRNMICEINPFSIPERQEKDAYLFRDYVTTDTYADSDVIESRGFARNNVQVYNKDASAGVEWRLLGSHNAEDWQVIHTPSGHVAGGEGSHVLVTAPWNFIKAQIKSAAAGSPAKVAVFVGARRQQE